MQAIYLIRHGKTQANLEGRLSGHTDTDLVQDKLEITNKFKATLNPKPGYKVFSSPSIRAVETAKCFDSVYEIVEEFKELNFGLFENLTFDEIKSIYPNEFEIMIKESVNYHFPEGESFAKLIARASKALTQILESDKENDIVIFTHGGVIQSLLSYFMCGNESMYWNFRISNASVTKLYFCEGLPVLDKLNL